uniref:Uncharacterized protein n=1 Tax=Heterorhabditis bacteriophora TaxID=37862 RepID=A0A1I7WDA9_HETBA
MQLLNKMLPNIQTRNKRSALCILTQRPSLGPHLYEYDNLPIRFLFVTQINDYVRCIDGVIILILIYETY